MTNRIRKPETVDGVSYHGLRYTMSLFEQGPEWKPYVTVTVIEPSAGLPDETLARGESGDVALREDIVGSRVEAIEDATRRAYGIALADLLRKSPEVADRLAIEVKTLDNERVARARTAN